MRWIDIHKIAVGLALLAMAVTAPANAQTGFGGGTRGGTTTGFGSGNSAFGSSTFGGSSFGTSSFGGTGGIGSNRLGGTGSFGSSAFGGGIGTTTLGTGLLGSQIGTTGGFVGRSAADMQAAFQGANPFQSSNFANNFLQQQTTRNFRVQQNQGQNQGAGTTRTPVRARLNVAFDRPPVASTPLIADLNVNVRSLLDRRGVAGAEVEFDGQAVTLRGSVADEHERRLVELIVSMQPGVSEIRNELIITSGASSSPTETE